ncbi:MAG TPA: diaminopimelate epimerase [Kiritimatiellia bacterium]|jgi:diaminopimelate epimerase
MQIPFWKMHGAANDFILVDDRQETFPTHDQAWLARVMQRRTGIGSEGVLLIQPSNEADLRMRFFNPDGGEVDMCGNGARCLARLAHELNIAPQKLSIETPAGLVRAEVEGDHVRLHMPEPRDWRLNGTLVLRGEQVPYHYVICGVPHVVIEVENLDAYDVAKIGEQIRYDKAFQPSGTNANFIEVTGPDSLRVRTYERGVEGETLACGTGITAAGLIAGKLGLVRAPVKVTPASGDVLAVNFKPTDGGATSVSLYGPAEHVFKGELEYPG